MVTLCDEQARLWQLTTRYTVFDNYTSNKLWFYKGLFNSTSTAICGRLLSYMYSCSFDLKLSIQ